MKISRIALVAAGLFVTSSFEAQASDDVDLGDWACSQPSAINYTATYKAKATADVNMLAMSRVTMTSQNGSITTTLSVNGIACPNSATVTNTGINIATAAAQCQQHVVAGNSYIILGQSLGSGSNQGNVCLGVMALDAPK